MNKQLSLLAGAFAVALVTGVLTYFDCFSGIDSLLTDRLCQSPGAVDPRIKIIAIDEKTLERAENPDKENWGRFGTWSRSVTASLISTLNKSEETHPAVIGLDIMYFGSNTAAGDSELAQAAAAGGNVVTASHFVFEDKLIKDSNGNAYLDKLHISLLEEPYPALKAATKQGYSNASADSDGIVRRTMPFIVYNSEKTSSFATACYEAYTASLGKAPVMPKLSRGGEWWIPYSSMARQYEHISLIDVLDGTVPAEAFDGCIVLLGAYAPGLQDSFTAPVDKGNQMYGVEIHANIIEALLDGRWALPVENLSVQPILTAVLCGALFLLFSKIRLRCSTLLAAAVIAANIAACAALYRSGIIIKLAYLPIFTVLLYLGVLVWHYLSEVLRRRQVTAAFKKYVAPQVVDELSKSGSFRLVLGGENRHIAVLFVDIRGFTTMSESLAPEEVVEILNDYLSLTTSAIFANSGTLDKFIGDATMAVFNAPFDLDDYIFRAVCAAYDMVSGSVALQERLQERFGRAVSFGIGINCGNAVVGNIGCDFRMDYTAIGDTVNTASRLEGSAKAGQVLISREVYEAVKDRVTVTEVGEIPLKGKSTGVFVYSLEKVEGKGSIKGENV